MKKDFFNEQMHKGYGAARSGHWTEAKRGKRLTVRELRNSPVLRRKMCPEKHEPGTDLGL